MAVFRENRLFAFYTALVAFVVLLAIFAPFLAPQDPMAGDMKLVQSISLARTNWAGIFSPAFSAAPRSRSSWLCAWWR